MGNLCSPEAHYVDVSQLETKMIFPAPRSSILAMQSVGKYLVIADNREVKIYNGSQDFKLVPKLIEIPNITVLTQLHGHAIAGTKEGKLYTIDPKNFSQKEVSFVDGHAITCITPLEEQGVLLVGNSNGDVEEFEESIMGGLSKNGIEKSGIFNYVLKKVFLIIYMEKISYLHWVKKVI